jgi:hypothetical protein
MVRKQIVIILIVIHIRDGRNPRMLEAFFFSWTTNWIPVEKLSDKVDAIFGDTCLTQNIKIGITRHDGAEHLDASVFCSA